MIYFLVSRLKYAKFNFMLFLYVFYCMFMPVLVCMVSVYILKCVCSYVLL